MLPSGENSIVYDRKKVESIDKISIAEIEVKHVIKEHSLSSKQNETRAFLKPSNILGSSLGLTGSTAILITDCVLNFNGLRL